MTAPDPVPEEAPRPPEEERYFASGAPGTPDRDLRRGLPDLHAHTVPREDQVHDWTPVGGAA